VPRNGDGVYTRRDRPGYWISWKDSTGQRRRRKVEARTLAQARDAYASERVRAEQARTMGFAPPTEDSFEEVARQYLSHRKPRLSSANYERECGIIEDHLKPFFAGKLAAIKRATIARYMTARCAAVSNATVVKELNVLKHLLKLAVEEWEYIPVNPATGVKAPKPAPGRVRYLQPTELRAAIEAAPEWLKPVIALAAATGMRRSEILRLRWLDVDLRNSRVLLAQTKNGEGRIVYLNRLAVAALESLNVSERTKPTDLLFAKLKPEWVSVAFLRLCRTLAISDFRFHDLRHTAASWLRMKGADIHTVAQLLGHKDLRMAARYQHLSPEFLSDAVNRLDTAFAECHPYVTKEKLLKEGELANA
jgi:integrase